MTVKIIVLDFNVSRRVKRMAAWLIPVAVLLLGFGATVDAAPQTFGAGEPLSASKMNGNFAELDGRVAKAEARLTVNNGYSIGAVFRKATPTATAGDLSGLSVNGITVAKGWAGTRAACQATVGSPTAHMCTSEEITRSAVLGLPLQDGWYASDFGQKPGGYAEGWSGSSRVETKIGAEADCFGFTNASYNWEARGWHASAAESYSRVVSCSTIQPVLCCDTP